MWSRSVLVFAPLHTNTEVFALISFIKYQIFVFRVALSVCEIEEGNKVWYWLVQSTGRLEVTIHWKPYSGEHCSRFKTIWSYDVLTLGQILDLHFLLLRMYVAEVCLGSLRLREREKKILSE